MTNANCIFCKIIKGDIPTTKIFEDENFLVFMDIRPLSPGHSLVIPKEHYRWVWDVPNVGNYFEVVAKIAKAQKKAFGVEMVCSKVVGEEVHHAHVWVYPDPDHTNGDKSNFIENADKIKKAL